MPFLCQRGVGKNANLELRIAAYLLQKIASDDYPKITPVNGQTGGHGAELEKADAG
jgi:hypothetical protein